jgi:hypothetical protein
VVIAALGPDSASNAATAYFGQLSAVIEALSGQVTIDANADLLASQPGVCVETVVFSQVASPTGIVYALGLGDGWGLAGPVPSPDAEGGNLHQQLVDPPSTAAPGQSWQVSAGLSTPDVKLQSDPFPLQLQDQAGSTQTWLVNGAAVSCDAPSGT